MILQDVQIPTITSGLNAIYAVFLTLTALIGQQLIAWMRNRKPHREMKINMETLVNDVSQMKAELKTNGGSSIKDFVASIHTDVKELKSEFYNLRVQQRVRLEMQLDSMAESIFICNETGDCTFANRSLCNLFGLSKEKMLNSNWLTALQNQKEKRDVYEEWGNAVEEQISFSMEYTITNQMTQKEIRVLATAEPIKDDQGNLMWFQGQVKNKIII